MVWIRRRILTALVIALVTTCLVGLCHSVSARLAAMESPLAGALLRLHVIANSDTFEDQALKLEVRDAILDSAAALLDGVTSKDEATRLIVANLDRLSAVSTDVVKARGYDYAVSVCTGRFAFPDKTYGMLRVPAGEYDAVRVIIGAGRGSNWWCVIFPPLCFIDVSGAEPTVERSPAPSLPALIEAGGDGLTGSGADTSDVADLRERLQAYLQNHVRSGESALKPGYGAETTGGREDGGRDELGGLIARLEGEIGRLTRHFALPRFAIQPWLGLF